MAELVINRNHVAVSASSLIDEICQPLFKKFDIRYFNYSRVYPDYAHTSLTSNSEWADFFYREDYKNKFLYNESLSYELGKFKIILWHIFPENQLIINLQQYYSLDHGIIILEHGSGFKDFYSFAFRKDDLISQGFFLNNIYLLEKFILYFKDKAKELIEVANANKIYLPNIELPSKEYKPIFFNNESVQEFLDSIKADKYYLMPLEERNKYLTAREMECIFNYVSGKSSKQIAKMMKISSRTVESYIQAVKSKLGFRYKTELMDLFKSKGL